MPTKKVKTIKKAEKPKKTVRAKPAKRAMPKKPVTREVVGAVKETAAEVIEEAKKGVPAKTQGTPKQLFESVPKAKYFYSVGRRKTAIAQVRLYEEGRGNLVVNGKDAKAFFGGLNFLATAILAPIELVGYSKKFDVYVKTVGGGVNAQAEAARLGVARALLIVDPELKSTLRKAGFLTRDPRKKERKKPGLKRARRAPQFSKR